MVPSSPPPVRRIARKLDQGGFTLLEALITLTVLSIVAGALMFILNMMSHSKQSTTNSVEATDAAKAALDLMGAELRSAGYGSDTDYPADPQPAIAYVDSTEVIFAANFAPYPDTTSGHTQPLAYDPVGDPKPKPLTATAWTPNQKYRTGAELIRYTLDANNDGLVNASDQSSSAGNDAARTRNPDDYVLLRQVYGDSTGNQIHNNGGATQSIALVRKPGGGVPPIFTVYLRGQAAAWNWANGPVPADKLSDIERLTLQVTAASPQPDSRGGYAQSTLRTQVTSTRNLPNFLTTTYAVQGYVYQEVDMLANQGAGDPGIPGVTVRIGNSYSTTTNSSGFYLVRVPAGTYTVRHYPIAGYGNYTTPDSFVVSVGPGVTRSFADTARAGGHVDIHVFNDYNANAVEDTGEPPLGYITAQILPGGSTAMTDLSGNSNMFVPVGFYSVLLNVPDTLSATTTNPRSSTMANGGTATMTFGLHASANCSMKGRVFNDINRNGTQDSGEPGYPNIWVGATLSLGATNSGFAYTDANGDYTITTPANNPPGTTPYYVYFLPPSGFFPTTASARGPIYLAAGAQSTGNNFGVGAFQVISLSASRVLSLASANLMENDWTTNITTARQDRDILLGADAGGTDNISVWFNQYNANPIFNSSPLSPAGSGYTRNAPNSVLAIAADTLDSNAPRSRPDVVTGTKKTGTGNLFVWFNQNTSGNEGYIPSTFSPAQNYTTADAGDVSSVLTLQCSGGGMPDLIVGTRSPLAGRGTVEIWENSNAATPVFTRQEVYPASGSVPGARMGEVASMALGDLDGDGDQDLVVVTKTGDYSGEVLAFKNIGLTNGNRFVYDWGHDVSDAATCVTVTDVNGDGRKDIVFGTQAGSNSGTLEYWRNNTSGSSLDFNHDQSVDAPGIVMSITSADFGASGRNDIAIGWRRDDINYIGGTLIYYTDTGGIPTFGTDPSNSSIQYMAPAVTAGNFNYGVRPTQATAPYLPDLAAGIKITATTGALVIFIR